MTTLLDDHDTDHDTAATTASITTPAAARRRTLGRVLLAGLLALGLAGVGVSLDHPGWFAGSTADAGMLTPPINGHGPSGGPATKPMH